MKKEIVRRKNVTFCDVYDSEGELVKEGYRVDGRISPPRLLIRVRRDYGQFVTIRNARCESVRYGLDVKEFFKYAHVIEESENEND